MKNISEVTERQIAVKVESLMAILGRNIKKERLNSKLSRVDLAFYAKTTESVICSIENGKKTGISVYTLVKIAESLQVPLNILFIDTFL